MVVSHLIAPSVSYLHHLLIYFSSSKISHIGIQDVGHTYAAPIAQRLQRVVKCAIPRTCKCSVARLVQRATKVF